MRYSSTIFLVPLLLIAPQVTAQVIPDRTLPNNTIVTPNGNASEITGGTTAQNNLFHSFEQFSVPTGGEAHFNNASKVENIFSRVTGQSISNIDGLIRANGNANLFLLNPNGILFGPNARLDLGGSFFGTTADRVVFADGFEFSTSNTSSSPVLTVSVPVGLGFGNSPKPIQVQGTGHQLTVADPIFSPVIRGNLTGLQVKPGQTLGLIGGNLLLEGGMLSSEGGRIELGSVGNGLVKLDRSANIWTLNYNGVNNFQDITLSYRSLVDASAMQGGSIALRGNQITINGGSAIIVQNFGSFKAGNIFLAASDNLQVNGVDSTRTFRSQILSEVFAGSGSDIAIATPDLLIRDGGAIATKAYQEGQGGNLIVDTLDNLLVVGFSPFNPLSFSLLATATFGSQNSGNVAITSNSLTVANSGTIGTTTFDNGKGGNLDIQARNILVDGGSPVIPIYSSLIANTAGNGNSGNININTLRLTIKDGGVITTATGNQGTAGTIKINATEFVILTGKGLFERDQSRIISSANSETERIRAIFNLPLVGRGGAGSLTIITQKLEINDGIVEVGNNGVRNAGNLNISASSISLDADGRISASTNSGDGGNIFIKSDNLRLNNNSSIAAIAGGTGNGGNIKIDTDILVGLENSDITANAFEGQGGSINITTRGIFGLEIRERLSPNNDITAFSQQNPQANGAINVEILQPVQSEPVAPIFTISTDRLLARSCLTHTGEPRGTIVNTGAEGIPITPDSGIDSSGDAIEIPKPESKARIPTQSTPREQTREREDLSLNNSEVSKSGNVVAVRESQWKIGDPIVEPTQIVKTDEGIVPIAAPVDQTPVLVNDLICH